MLKIPSSSLLSIYTAPMPSTLYGYSDADGTFTLSGIQPHYSFTSIGLLAGSLKKHKELLLIVNKQNSTYSLQAFLNNKPIDIEILESALFAPEHLLTLPPPHPHPLCSASAFDYYERLIRIDLPQQQELIDSATEVLLYRIQQLRDALEK